MKKEEYLERINGKVYVVVNFKGIILERGES
jgi:hypothetical protein